MISQERIQFALDMYEKLERVRRSSNEGSYFAEQKRKDFSIEDAKRRLRILEVLSK